VNSQCRTVQEDPKSSRLQKVKKDLMVVEMVRRKSVEM